jgi:hypothetical protein
MLTLLGITTAFILGSLNIPSACSAPMTTLKNPKSSISRNLSYQKFAPWLW